MRALAFQNMLALLFSFLVYTSCTAPTTVAGGSDNPDFIVITALTSKGSPAVEAKVECASSSYNPLATKRKALLSAQTDKNGHCGFFLPDSGSVTIALYHPTTGERLLFTTVNSNNGDTILFNTIQTSPPASIKILIPNTPSLSQGFIPGTSIHFSTQDPLASTPGYTEITIDSVPAGALPPLMTQNENGSFPISDSVTTEAGRETAIVSQGETTGNRPLWKIKSIVGIRTTLATQFGENSTVEELLRSQMARMNHVFSHSIFHGGLLFSIDSLYFFSGSAKDETGDLTNFALRILLSDETSTALSEWNYANKTVLHTPTATAITSLFDEAGDRSLVRGLALSRGCFDRRSSEIDSSKNSCNGEEYRGEPSWVNGRGSGFTDLDREMINDAKGDASYEESALLSKLADTLGVQIIDSQGNPVAGRSIDVFRSVPESYSIGDIFLALLSTDSQGKVTIGYRPFSEGAVERVNYSTFLIKVSGGATDIWRWCTLEEVAQSGIRGIGSRYDVIIQE